MDRFLIPIETGLHAIFKYSHIPGLGKMEANTSYNEHQSHHYVKPGVYYVKKTGLYY